VGLLVGFFFVPLGFCVKSFPGMRRTIFWERPLGSVGCTLGFCRFGAAPLKQPKSNEASFPLAQMRSWEHSCAGRAFKKCKFYRKKKSDKLLSACSKATGKRRSSWAALGSSPCHAKPAVKHRGAAWGQPRSGPAFWGASLA